MAQRYGGRFSPGNAGGHGPLAGARPTRVNLLARLMYLAPLPLLPAGLLAVGGGRAGEALVELSAFGALMLGAWLLNEGLKAEAAYDARKVARPPGVPRKLLAALLAGAGVLAVQAVGAGLVPGILFGAMAAGAHVLGFGIDPMRPKGIEGVAAAESARAAAAIAEAEAMVAEIRKSARATGDRAIADRAEAMAARARDVFRAVEEDPRDLRRARRFLGVYLKGARDATTKYAALPEAARAGDARAEYLALLSDLEESFAKHREDLLADDRTDLDVEVEVLRERLKREGLEA